MSTPDSRAQPPRDRSERHEASNASCNASMNPSIHRRFSTLRSESAQWSIMRLSHTMEMAAVRKDRLPMLATPQVYSRTQDIPVWVPRCRVPWVIGAPAQAGTGQTWNPSSNGKRGTPLRKRCGTVTANRPALVLGQASTRTCLDASRQVENPVCHRAGKAGTHA